MGIFRRGKQTAATDETLPGDAADDLSAGDSTRACAAGAEDAGADPDGLAAGSAGAGTGSDEDTGTASAAGAPRTGRREELGPFDSSEVDGESDGRLDLGGLRIQGVPGMELRLEVDEEAGQVVGATAVLGDSAVQLQAFAAPRTAGIWDEIRGEIAESILNQGGTADEVRGELGLELRTRMPSAGPDGRTVFAPARFAGVDGPRWFLRAVFSGRAAIEDEAAAPLLEVVRSTVVVRGDAAMAPREMLPLQLPAQADGPGADSADPDHDVPARRADDLKPFERGPEITEVR
ncbi:DUF3710 domain-containing protein [Pedococcus sp. NPDC057267]|uniref:DUF3710 domain-containing protein n=1 Tax=Pedococcus sp. NPDC057267 TaxID=3346077 RepID=UPI00363FC073